MFENCIVVDPNVTLIILNIKYMSHNVVVLNKTMKYFVTHIFAYRYFDILRIKHIL